MKRTVHAIRQPVRRPHADTYLLLTLLSFALSVSLTRLFLALTGYPQIGDDVLHISHVLWGGLLLFLAALLPLLVANRWVYRVTAILAGVGIGLFIDEVGKFVTASYDYFFTPAAPIIYAFFLICVLLYLQVSKPRPRHPRSELYATMELIEELLDHDLDENERSEIKSRLAYVIEQEDSPDVAALAQDLFNYFEVNQLNLTPVHPGWLDRSLERLRAFELQYLDQNRLKQLLILGILALGIGSILVPVLATLVFVTESNPGPGNEMFWFLAFQLLMLAGGLLLIYAVILLRHGEDLRGMRISYITLLVYLTIFNLFLFYYYQFGVILAAVYQFSLLLGVLHYQRRYNQLSLSESQSQLTKSPSPE
jgi:hypothetical protein